MGILQNYTNNGSEYKSLKFGKDQPEGGSSKQPFMQKDINKAEPIQPGLMAFPSVLRGGIYSAALAATDVVRLTKYFTTPNGIQFALNQNLLSRLAPRTEASGVLNEYIYTPLSTLAQAGVGNLGIHLNKQGLDPTGLTNFAIKPYGEVVSKLSQDENRLIKLTKEHIGTTYVKGNLNSVLRDYKGGPGSILGIGRTKIKFATNASDSVERTMGSNLNDPKTYLTPGSGSVGLSIYDSTYKDDIQQKTLASYTSQINPLLKGYGREIVDQTTFNPNIQTLSAYASGSSNPVGKYSSQNTLIVDPVASRELNPAKKWNKHKDGYLANLNKSVGYYVDYNTDEVKVSTGLLGNHGVGPDFRTTNRNIRGFKDKNTKYYDHVTEYSDYWTTGKTIDHVYYRTDTEKRTSNAFGSSNDLISFRIGVLNHISPEISPTYTFRAYIDNMSDSYDADWSAQTYMGRGEKLYKYNSFGRSISLGFTVVAEGSHHLGEMYKQLNSLASSLAPTYVGGEYMMGNIHQLTVGNYVNNQYGIITGFTYDIDNESPWEINPDSQLPHFIKVTGFKFTPIHDFRPEYGNGQFISQNTNINTNRPQFTPPLSSSPASTTITTTRPASKSKKSNPPKI